MLTCWLDACQTSGPVPAVGTASRGLAAGASSTWPFVSRATPAWPPPRAGKRKAARCRVRCSQCCDRCDLGWGRSFALPTKSFWLKRSHPETNDSANVVHRRVGVAHDGYCSALFHIGCRDRVCSFGRHGVDMARLSRAARAARIALPRRLLRDPCDRSSRRPASFAWFACCN